MWLDANKEVDGSKSRRGSLRLRAVVRKRWGQGNYKALNQVRRERILKCKKISSNIIKCMYLIDDDFALFIQ